MSRAFSKKIQGQAFLRCGGKCEKCSAHLKVGEGEYDHIVPYALTQDSTLDNCQVLCVPCHRGVGAKTSDDIRTISKAKRNWLKHNGIKQDSTFPKPPKGTKFNWKAGRYERADT